MHPSHIMTQREIIRNNLNKSDWEITKDKCDSTRAHRRHLAANGKHENKRKIYCTNVHLRIIEILITLMYNLSAVTAAVTVPDTGNVRAPLNVRRDARTVQAPVWRPFALSKEKVTGVVGLLNLLHFAKDVAQQTNRVLQLLVDENIHYRI